MSEPDVPSALWNSSLCRHELSESAATNSKYLYPMVLANLQASSKQRWTVTDSLETLMHSAV